MTTIMKNEVEGEAVNVEGRGATVVAATATAGTNHTINVISTVSREEYF